MILLSTYEYYLVFSRQRAAICNLMIKQRKNIILSQKQRILHTFGILITIIYSGAKKYWHPYYINTIEMRSL